MGSATDKKIAIKIENMPVIEGVHHVAYRCRDAEETRHFYEDLLGLKLAAALAFDKEPTGKPLEYMHLFFELQDGSYLAFFDEPVHSNKKFYKLKWGIDLHIALQVESKEKLLEAKQKLRTRRIRALGPINHDFVHSIYFFDPNGYAVELTYRDAEHAAIMEHEATTAHENIRRWTENKKKLTNAADQ